MTQNSKEKFQSIIRVVHNRENPFVQLNKQALWDQNLSLKAVGLWARCMSRPNDWTFSLKELVDNCKEGRRAVDAAMHELIAANYVYRIEYAERDLNGKFKSGGIEYVFFEFPATEEEKQKRVEEFKKSFRNCCFGNCRNGDCRNVHLLIKNNTKTESETHIEKDNVLLKTKELATEDSKNVYEREISLIDEGKVPDQYHILKTESKTVIKEDNVLEKKKTMPSFRKKKVTMLEDPAKRWKLDNQQLISLAYLKEQHVPADSGTLAYWAKTYSLERLREVVAYAKCMKPDNLVGYIQKLLRQKIVMDNAVALKNREVAAYFAKAHLPGRLKLLKRYCVLTLENGTKYDLEYQIDSETFYRALESKI